VQNFFCGKQFVPKYQSALALCI